MKKRKCFRRLITYVLMTVMIVSSLSVVDMGWNVIDVHAETINITEAGPYSAGNNGGRGLYVKGTTFYNNYAFAITVKVGDTPTTVGAHSNWTVPECVSAGFSSGTIGSMEFPFTPKHNYYKEATCTEAASCGCGATQGSALGHSYSAATCDKKATCSRCGDTKGDYTPHNDIYSSQTATSITLKCNAGCNRTTTYTLNPNGCKGEIDFVNRNTYSGATVSKSGSASDTATVTYKGTDKNGAAYGPTTTKPSDTGNYEAYITVAGKTVSCSFKIKPGGDIYQFNKGTGESGSMTDQLVLHDGFVSGTKLNKNAFVKTGYSFDKWLSEKGDFADESEVREPDLSDPWTLALTAQWTPNDYKITFDPNVADVSDGTAEKTVTFDGAIPSITIPEKNCSIFKGYFTALNGGGTKIYNEDGSSAVSAWKIPNDTTLYANWDINHDWGYEASENQVIATCQNPVCKFSQKMTLSATDSVYNKSPYNKASVTNEKEFPQKKDLSDVKYVGIENTDYAESSSAPTNVGDYKAMVTVSNDGTDYTAEKSFNIAKANQNATVSVADYKWGEDDVPSPAVSGVEESAEPTYYYNTINSNVGGKLWSTLTNETLDAGTYYVYATLAETDNYNSGVTPTSSFKVNGKEVDPTTITTVAYSETYDAANHTIEFNIDDTDPTLVVTFSDSETGTYANIKPNFKEAGSYKVYYKVKKFGYEVYTNYETVDIAKKEVTVSGVKAKEKVYDGNKTANLDYSGVVYDGIITGDVLSVTAKGTYADANVGTDISIALSDYELGGKNGASYVLATSGHQADTSASITQRQISIDWGTVSFDYDGTEKKPVATAGNLVTGDICDITVEVEGGSSVNAGSYTVKATELSNTNYKMPPIVTKAFTINKINQSGTLTMAGYEYTDAEVSTPSVSGYNETPIITYYYSLENKNIGGTVWKDIVPKSLEPDTYYMYAVLGSTTNYKEYTTPVVSFVINGADMSGEVTASGNEVTYTGLREHGITVTAPVGASIAYGTVEDAYTYSTCPSFKDVNTYTIYYKVTKKGFNPVKGSKEVKINKADLHVTPNANQAKVYGDEDPVFTYTVNSSELLGTDTASVVSGTIKRAGGEDVNEDGYEFSDNDLTATNYKVYCNSGVVFKITPRDISADMITLTTKKFGVTGSDIDVAANGNITVKYKDVVRAKGTDYEISNNIESAIGTYNVTITGKGNFKGSADKEWRITKPIVEGITADNETKTYDGNEYTITVNGTQDGDTVTFGTSETSIEEESVNYKEAGVYTIWYKVDRDAEHEPYESSAVLTINPKEASIVWGNTSLVYNGSKQAPSATVNADSLVGTDVCNIVTGSDEKNVGTGYIATAIALSNKNYKLPSALPTTLFDITPKEITVKANNVSKYVGDAEPKLSYVAVGICSGDSLTNVTLSRAGGEKVGSYTITVTVDAAANPNYTITTQNGLLTINERPAKEEPKGDDSGNTTPVKPTTKVEKPAIVLPELSKNTESSKNDFFKQNIDDFNRGSLVLDSVVTETAPIKSSSVDTPVSELLDHSDIFTEEEITAIKNGVNARVWTALADVDISKISEEEHNEINSVAKSLEGDGVKLLYFDVSLFKQVGDGETTMIHEPGTFIEITIDLPVSVINTDDTMVRDYKVLRLHEGEVAVLDATYDPDTQTITFATDKFSTYVLAYSDKPVKEIDAISDDNAADNNPVTGTVAEKNNIPLFVGLLILLLIVVALIIIYIKNRKKNKKLN